MELLKVMRNLFILIPLLKTKAIYASVLVNEVLMQIVKTVDGNYQSLDYFSLPR